MGTKRFKKFTFRHAIYVWTLISIVIFILTLDVLNAVWMSINIICSVYIFIMSKREKKINSKLAKDCINVLKTSFNNDVEESSESKYKIINKKGRSTIGFVEGDEDLEKLLKLESENIKVKDISNYKYKVTDNVLEISRFIKDDEALIDFTLDMIDFYDNKILNLKDKNKG